MANTTCSGTSSKADIRTSACILSLANETLYLIADILAREPIDLTSFMLSCKPLAAIAENVRYSGLMISGVPGRRLMSTLLSGTTAATRYCITVKRVWFRGSGGCDMHLMSSLLAEMLPRLGGLTALWLEASPLDAIQLMERMRKNGMIRERIHPAFFIRDVASSGPCTPLKNPCLKFVRLSGDPVMAGIIAHRRLEELDMSHLMDHDEFAHFISNAEHSNLGDALKSLTIKLGRIIKIELALPLIATAFPELVSLTIEQTQLSVKNTLDYFTTQTPIFPKLENLVLNRRHTYKLSTWGTLYPCDAPCQEDLDAVLAEISNKNKIIKRIGIGRQVILMERNGNFVRALDDSRRSVWNNMFGSQLEAWRFTKT